MSPGRGAVRLLLLALFLVVVGPAVDAAAQTSDTPTLEVSPAAASIGQDVQATVHHWPEGVANVELCGNRARGGSADCDVLGGMAVVVPADGRASVTLTLGEPPGGCPCVLRAVQVGGRTAATADIVVTDAPVATETEGAVEDARRELEVDGVRIVDSSTWTALFGAGADRTLELTLRNTGTVPIATPVLSLSFAGDDDRPGEVVTSSALDPMEPGEERRVELAFTLPALSMGEQAIEGRIDGGAQPVTFAAQTATTPWGLVILVGLGAYLLVLRGVMAVLSRRRTDTATTQDAAAADDELDLVTDQPPRESPAVFALPEPAPAPVPAPVPPLGDVVTTGAAIVRIEVDPSPNGSVVRWDPFGGVTAESVLGALIDAGAPIHVLDRALATIDLPGCRLEVRDVAATRLALAATSARVHVDQPDLRHDRAAVHRLLERSELSDTSRRRVLAVLAMLADAEAAVRRFPYERPTIAGQDLASIIACCIALDSLAIVHGTCEPISIGRVRVDDGRTPEPVPDPVTAELLRRHRLPWRTGTWPAARCTPVGVALLAATSSLPSASAAETVSTAVGYAAATHGQDTTVTFRVLVCEGRDAPAPAVTPPPASAGHLPASSQVSRQVVES